MKRKSILIVLSGLFFFGLLSTNLFAQDHDKSIIPDQPVVQEQPRVIEEALVLSDPTVAQPKKWLIGASGEYWYVSQKWNRYSYNAADPDNPLLYSEGSLKGSMPGGTITFGYDKLTMSYSYRKGSFDGGSEIQGTFTSNGLTTTTTLKQDQAEHEIMMRVMLGPGSPHFNPYLLLGYNHTIKTDTETLIDPGWTWKDTGSPIKKEDFTFKSPFFGLGAIIPFNKYIGMRLDGRFLYTFADYVRDDGWRKNTDTLYGFAAVGTFYWAIWKGLNAQVGGKWQYTSAGMNKDTDIGSLNKWGAFGMLGYTYKF
jgi:hypothetical protein